MDALTEHEIEVIVQRLETLVTDLEHNRSTPTLYAFVLLAQEFAGMKKSGCTLAHIGRYLALAHRMRPLRDMLVVDPFNFVTYGPCGRLSLEASERR